MSHKSDKLATKICFQPTGMTSTVRGTVQRTDLVGREITVILPEGLAVFDVPSDCPILLRGERIKLRLIQPRDQVRVAIAVHQGRQIAQLLEVQPDSGFICTSG